MKLLVILGSRNPEGQTARAADAFFEGFVGEGHSGERVFLPQIEIEACRQCEDDGWGDCRAKGRCIIDDDFEEVVEKIRDADVVAFATPVYFSDLSERMKSFLDRLRRISRHENGRAGLTDKVAVGICVAGGGGGGGPSCTVSLEKVLRTTGFDLVDIVPARRQNLDLKCDVLRLTGRWVAQTVGA